MGRLDRYLAGALFRSTLLVAVVLVSVLSLGSLVKELDDVGEGSYGVGDALLFVLMTAPRKLIMLGPAWSLLGGVVCLGGLAASRELLAMRALGYSIGRIGRAAVVAALPVAIGIGVLSETIAPALDEAAHTRRAIAVSGLVAASTERGFWFRDGNDMVRVGEVRAGQHPVDVEIFEFDEAGRHTGIVHADEARLEKGGVWRLLGVRRQRIDSGGVRTERLDEVTRVAALEPPEIGLARDHPASLSPSHLRELIQLRADRGQESRAFSVAFWQIVVTPFTILIMVLLAVPFAFGSLRSSSFGRRVMSGALVGIGFYLLNQVLGHAAVAMALPPVMPAVLPTAIAGVTAAILIRRASR